MPLLTETEAERYVLLRAWARERPFLVAADGGPIYLEEGFSPYDRWARLEEIYADHIEVNPDDGLGV